MRHHFEKARPGVGPASKIVMFKNVMQVIIWGIWLMVALNVFPGWKIMAAMATSLPAYQPVWVLHPRIFSKTSTTASLLDDGPCEGGDYIICDGTRGKVSSISYTSDHAGG